MSSGARSGGRGHRGHGEVHGSGSRRRERSRAGAECVRAPTEMKSTPGLCDVPDRLEVDAAAGLELGAPVHAAPRSRAAAPGSCCRAGSASAPAASASSTSACVAALDLHERCRPGRAARALRTAAPTPPAIAAWFSLMRIASKSPMRWLVPPPARHGRLLEQAQPRRRLARVEDARAGARDRARRSARSASRRRSGAAAGSARCARRRAARRALALDAAAPGPPVAPHALVGAGARTRAPGSSRAERELGGVEPEEHARLLLRDRAPARARPRAPWPASSGRRSRRPRPARGGRAARARCARSPSTGW